MQPVDLTTLRAVCADLQHWLPARLETVYQRDRHTIALALRTLKKQDWLTLSWHPQAARIAFEPPPPANQTPLPLVSNSMPNSIALPLCGWG